MSTLTASGLGTASAELLLTDLASQDEQPLLENSIALEQFLASVEKRAYRMAYIATNNRDDALDIVQEAMMKLVQRYSKREHSEWGPLFQRILQSKIRDCYRRSSVRNKFRVWLGRVDNDADTSTDVMDSLVDEAAINPNRQVQNEQSMAQLQQALQQLPLRQQQAFLLRMWEGYDVAQTAAVMSCSQGSVKTHYSRALQKLQQLLGDYY